MVITSRSTAHAVRCAAPVYRASTALALRLFWSAWAHAIALLTAALRPPFPRGSLPCAPSAGHLYDAEAADGEDGSSWYSHRDYCADDRLAALSIIVQGSTPGGFAGGALALGARDAPGGSEDERYTDGEVGGRAAEEGARAEVVALAPGDAVVLRQAWHEPQPITRGRRVAFVFFYTRVRAAAVATVGT